MPKRYGKQKTHQMKVDARLTPNDRQELVKFAGFLNDLNKLPKDELLAKHKAYMYGKDVDK